MRRLIVIAMCVVVLAAAKPARAQVNDDLIDRLENAATLIRDEKLLLAERQLSSILRSNPNQPDALNLLGAIRAKQRKFVEAEKLFSRAVSLRPDLVSARMNLVQLYLIQSNSQSAIAQLYEVVRLQPENDEAFDRLCHLLLSEKRYDEFTALLEAKSMRTFSVSLLISLGDVYLQKRDANNAERSFRLALEQQNEMADAILGLAQAAQLRGDLAAASSLLERAKKSTVTSAETLRRFALVAWDAGRYEEANQALTQAIKLKPNEPSYYVALGTTWLKKPDAVEAEKAFRAALALQADNAEAQMYLGYALMLQGKYPAAREMLEKSLVKQPAVPQTFFYLGLIAQELGDDQAAVQHFKKTLQIEPSFTDAHGALGRSYLNLKDYPQARLELELAIKLRPDDSQAHYQLAVLYARLKEPQRAQEQMQIVEQLKEAAKVPKNPGP